MFSFSGMRRFFTLMTIAAAGFCASPRATVNVDSLAVHSQASSGSRVVSSLTRGEAVTVDLVLTDSGGNWCGISRAEPSSISGYVPCGGLKREPAVAVASPANVTSPAASYATGIGGGIEEALDLSGAKQQIAQMADPAFQRLIVQSLPQHQLTVAQRSDLNTILNQALRPETIEGAVRRNLMKTASPEKLSALLGLLRSPLARRMTQAEVDAGSPDPQVSADFVAQIRKSPPSQTRLALIQGVDHATRTSQELLAMCGAMSRAMAEEANSQVAPERRMSRARIDQEIAQGEAQYAESMRRSVLTVFLFTYRNMSDSELRQYIALLESEPGQWFNRAVYQGFTEGAQQAGREVVRMMMARQGS